jgi:isopenicillin-N epimerase
VDGAHVVGMMALNVHDLGCDMYSSSPHKWLQAPKGSGFLYVRDEVIDRLWNTIVTAGWDEPKLRAERFQRIGSSNVPSLWGMRASVKLANDIGLDRIERRHRKMADYILGEMVKRGAESWTSPDAALRCAIASVNVSPIQRSWRSKHGCGRTRKSAFAAVALRRFGSRLPTICCARMWTDIWRRTTNTAASKAKLLVVSSG